MLQVSLRYRVRSIDYPRVALTEANARKLINDVSGDNLTALVS